MLDNLQLGEFIYEQPAVGNVEYTFKHALTHDVAYNSVLIERRKAMHERIGAALETLYADSLDARADQLAHHYRRSANVHKAVEYSRLAGQQAYRRGAYSEAIGHLTGALQLLRTMPEGPERSRQELGLELAYSEVLTTAESPSVEAVGSALRRARELCIALSDDERLFRVLLGLRWFCFFADRQQEALELSRQLLALAEPTHSPLRIIWAQVVFGQSLFERGEPIQARAHLEKAVALIPAVPPGAVLPVEDPRTLALSQLSWVLWTLGYPEQAVGRSREAIAVARELSKPYQLASAQYFACRLRYLRREPSPARELAEEVIALATERGFSLWMATGMAIRGWCLMEEGALEQGIKDLELGRAQWMAVGNADRLINAPLAEGYQRAGRFDEATAMIGDLLAVIEKTGTRSIEAEAHRLKGELMLAQNASKAAHAEQSLRTAIDISRKQHAKSWELRATTSLARLLAKQGKRDEARATLVEIYDWFTEGFDTADLREANTLLKELSE